MAKNPRGMGAFSKRWRRYNKIKPNAVLNLPWDHPFRRKPGKNPYVFHATRPGLSIFNIHSLKPSQSSTGSKSMSSALASVIEQEKSLPPSSKHSVVEIFKKIGVDSDGVDLIPKTNDLLEPHKDQRMFRILNFIGENLRAAKRVLKKQRNPYRIETEFSKNARILVDEGVQPLVSDFLNRNFANTQHHQELFEGKLSVKDPEVYAKALRSGFNVIVSSDFKMENDQDISYIAREVFRDNSLIQTKYGVHLRSNPIAMIVMPFNYSARDKIKALSNNQQRVASFINNPQEPILYLV